MEQTMELMDKQLYYDIIEQLSDLKYEGRVSPYLMNEPLLDDRLGDLLSFTRKQLPKAIIMFSTNGILLTKSLAAGFINGGVNRIIVSCYDPDTHNRVKAWNIKELDLIPFYERDLEKVFYNRGGNIDIGKKRGKRGSGCLKPDNQVYITHDGKAVLCCSDYKKEVVMGDTNIDPLLEIWNNLKYAEYRGALALGHRDELTLCKDCNF